MNHIKIVSIFIIICMVFISVLAGQAHAGDVIDRLMNIKLNWDPNGLVEQSGPCEIPQDNGDDSPGNPYGHGIEHTFEVEDICDLDDSGYFKFAYCYGSITDTGFGFKSNRIGLGLMFLF